MSEIEQVRQAKKFVKEIKGILSGSNTFEFNGKTHVSHIFLREWVSNNMELISDKTGIHGIQPDEVDEVTILQCLSLYYIEACEIGLNPVSEFYQQLYVLACISQNILDNNEMYLYEVYCERMQKA